MAQASFNQMMFFAVLGGGIGLAFPFVQKVFRGPSVTATPPPGTSNVYSQRPLESSGTTNVETLDNQSILTMTAAGLGDDIVIEKMKQSRCAFRLSSSDLAQLKQVGISERVIAAMLQNQTASGHLVG